MNIESAAMLRIHFCKGSVLNFPLKKPFGLCPRNGKPVIADCRDHIQALQKTLPHICDPYLRAVAMFELRRARQELGRLREYLRQQAIPLKRCAANTNQCLQCGQPQNDKVFFIK